MNLSRLGAVMVLVLTCIFMMAACGQKSAAKETVSPSMGPDTPSSHAMQQPNGSQSPTDILMSDPITFTVTGQVKEIMAADNKVQITGVKSALVSGDVIANISSDTVFIDGETEKYTDMSALKVGMEVQLTLSVAMTRSMPPIANAYMVVANYSIDKQMQPNYVIVSEIEPGAEGAVRLLNQNKDTYVSITADLQIDSITADGAEAGTNVKNTELKEGDVVIAWYGVVALSYPAQAGALRAELVVAK